MDASNRLASLFCVWRNILAAALFLRRYSEFAEHIAQGHHKAMRQQAGEDMIQSRHDARGTDGCIVFSRLPGFAGNESFRGGEGKFLDIGTVAGLLGNADEFGVPYPVGTDCGDGDTGWLQFDSKCQAVAIEEGFGCGVETEIGNRLEGGN